MRVLVACEESQAVTKELRRLGHEAYSCDLQECSGGHPEWHIRADALELLKMRWDMIIAHPPCTYLTAAGAVRLYNADHTVKDPERMERGREAARFFQKIWGGVLPANRHRESGTHARVRIAEVQSDHRAVFVRRPVAKENLSVVEGPAAADSDNRAGDSKGIVGRQHQCEKRSDNPGEIRIAQ